LIILFTEDVVSPLTLKAPASTTTKIVTPRPIFDGGSIVTAPPEIVTASDDTAMVCKTVPPALPDLNVILPVPLDTGRLKVMIILESTATPVEPIAGLKVMGTGGTFSLVAVRIPTFTFPLSSITVVPAILIAIFV
jgi:hypothetical protein